MSTRATVYIHWYDDSLLDIKLYHHWDWYVDYLWKKLDKALQNRRKWIKKDVIRAKTLIENITKIWWFEQAWDCHWDVEYIYHVYYDFKSWYDKDWKYYNDWRYRLECQSWMDYWEEILSKKPHVLLSQYWDWKKKKLDCKQSELDLWNREKFIESYFNS